MRPRPNCVTASFFAPPPKPIPEHFSVLISGDTARNKACQTYSTYDTYWPEAYMDHTDYFLISKTNKHLRTNTLSELTTIQENEKETQTSITYNKHKQTIYHCWTQPVFNFDQGEISEYFCSPIQLDYSTDADETMGPQTEVPRGSGVAISLEEESTRMALLLGSLSKCARHIIQLSIKNHIDPSIPKNVPAPINTTSEYRRRSGNSAIRSCTSRWSCWPN